MFLVKKSTKNLNFVYLKGRANKEIINKIAVVKFGKGNAVVIVPTYEQVIRPSEIRFGDLNPDDFDVVVVKSRVHFRRGFDETGYSKTVMVVDALGDFVGTTRLDGLDYKFGPIDELYPFKKK